MSLFSNTTVNVASRDRTTPHLDRLPTGGIQGAAYDKTREAAIDGPRTIRACRAMTITKLDLSGLKCPLPALKTRKALKSLTPGDWLEVRCTDPLAVIDIPHLVGVMGDRLEIIEHGERDTVFRIEKSAPTRVSKPPPC